MLRSIDDPVALKHALKELAQRHKKRTAQTQRAIDRRLRRIRKKYAARYTSA